MAVIPHTADVVVKDMGAALAFYRLLGLPIAADEDHAVQVEVATPGAMTLGFVLEANVREAVPGWPTPVGQRVTLAFKCDDAAAVDATYATMAAAGFGLRAPWDSPWGQRYAFLRDPDGNRVDLFA